jgi:hypothetical protein
MTKKDALLDSPKAIGRPELPEEIDAMSLIAARADEGSYSSLTTVLTGYSVLWVGQPGARHALTAVR